MIFKIVVVVICYILSMVATGVFVYLFSKLALKYIHERYLGGD